MNINDHGRCAVALIIEDPNNHPDEVLLGQMEYNSEKTLTGQWHYPGGKIESGEIVSDTSIREAKEETDLDVEFLGIIDTTITHTEFDDGSTRFRITFWVSCRVLTTSPSAKCGGDIRCLLWVPKKDSKNKCGPTAKKRVPETVEQFLKH